MKKRSFFFLLFAGTEIVLAENVLDVAKALDVSLFQHMTIRCNRPSLDAVLPNAVDCESGSADAVMRDFLTGEVSDKRLVATVLTTIVAYGHVWLPIVLIAVIALGIACCCCCRKRTDKKQTEEEKQALATQNPPQIVVSLFRPSFFLSCNCSLVFYRFQVHEPKKKKSILKQTPTQFSNGKVKDDQKDGEEKKPENYVTVDKVSEQPVDPNEGVVHASLTLGGEWPKNVKKIRAVEDGDEVRVAPKKAGKKKKVEQVKVENEEGEEMKPKKPLTGKSLEAKVEEEKASKPKRESSKSAERPKTPESRPKTPESRPKTPTRPETPEKDRDRRSESREPETKTTTPKKQAVPERRPRITRSELRALQEARKEEKEMQARGKSPTPTPSKIPVAVKNNDESSREGRSPSLGRYTTV